LPEISVSAYVICDESRTFEPFRTYYDTLVRMLGEVAGLLAWVLEMTPIL
tara:strand:+ start:273 stop:422 length:150 start_codon:yes stop_codon:yes gene_type:complete